MIRRPARSTQSRSSAASDVYKRQVGDQCTGAKVNGRMVPLRTELQNGDAVEIITSPNHTPSRDWLQFVKTTKARHKIRQWLKVAEREQSVALGKELLERELRKSGVSLQKLVKEGDDLKQIIQDLSFVCLLYTSDAAD